MLKIVVVPWLFCRLGSQAAGPDGCGGSSMRQHRSSVAAASVVEVVPRYWQSRLSCRLADSICVLAGMAVLTRDHATISFKVTLD